MEGQLFGWREAEAQCPSLLSGLSMPKFRADHSIVCAPFAHEGVVLKTLFLDSHWFTYGTEPI